MWMDSSYRSPERTWQPTRRWPWPGQKHGALEYFECVGDDLNPKMPGMQIARFTTLSKAKRGETVVFSFIVYKSKAHRDAVNKKVMKEMGETMNDHPQKMPFEMKRMAFGGFKTIVQA